MISKKEEKLNNKDIQTSDFTIGGLWKCLIKIGAFTLFHEYYNLKGKIRSYSNDMHKNNNIIADKEILDILEGIENIKKAIIERGLDPDNCPPINTITDMTTGMGDTTTGIIINLPRFDAGEDNHFTTYLDSGDRYTDSGGLRGFFTHH